MSLRNLLGALIAAAFLLSTSALTASAPTETASVPDGDPGQTYYAAFPTVITVDGDFSEWATLPHVVVTGGPQPGQNPDVDGRLTFAAAADMDNLYLSLDVTAKNIIAGQHGINYFNEDSVEVYINATGSDALTAYAPGVAQITIPAASIGQPPDRPLIGGQNFQGLGVRAAVVRTGTGYAIEAAVPLHNSSWNITPANDGSIGFQVQLNAATVKDRDIKVSWSSKDTLDQSYQNPSVFGRLIFFQTGPIPTATPAPTVNAALAAQGTFTVDGSTIIGPNGKPFVAHGVNINGENWVWRRSTVDDADLIADCWAFNLVRVNSFLFTGQQRWPQYADNNNLDQIVQTYTDRHVVVVFEAHDRIGSYYEGDDLTILLNWFTDLATRYKDNPYVWFDIINEPGGRDSVDAARWVGMHQQAIHAIRDVAGASNIIIVEGANGGQDAGPIGDSLIPTADSAILQYGRDVIDFGGKTYSNIVFSIHPYDQWNYRDDKLADFFDRVLKDDHAIIVGEYGVDTGQDVRRAAEAMFNTAVPRGIGRIVWHWDGSDNNDLTNSKTGGGWEIDDCSNPKNLTWLGQKVWDDNHAAD